MEVKRMTVEEFFRDTVFGVDDDNMDEEIFTANQLIKFASDYHAQETKQRKTELLSAGSYKQEEMKREYERGIEDGKTIAKHGTTNWID